MRRLATVVTTLALSVSGLVFSPAQANVPVDGDYTCAGGVKDGAGTKYAISNGVVSSGGGCTGAVVIPEGVTGIGSFAFQNSLLTSVNIPAGVTSIGTYAFQNSSITSATIPSSMTSIGARAFQDAKALTSITIPSSVTSIGLRTFQATTALTSITIPSSVTSIGGYAFKDSGITSITIPSSVTGVTGIGANAFENSQLTTVEFAPGSSLTGIPAGAFIFAQKLTSITIPETFTSIGDDAFRHTRVLTAITIPANVTSIGANAFFDSQGLATVTFQDGSKLASIGASSFGAATSLASINIPASVTSIGINAFESPSSLTAIAVASTNANFTSIDGVLFNKSETTLIRYPAKKSGTAYSIPATATSISNGAFGGATNLTSVTIPTSVTAIGDQAFRQATALSSVTIPAGVTSIGSSAFDGASALANITFTGNAAPTIGSSAFYGVASSAKAYINPGASGFATTGSPARWNGLAVALFYEGVSFNTNGGTAISSRDYLESITAPTAPTKAGHDFAGWTATNGGSSTITFPYAPSETSITLYAKWTPTPYAVTYDAKGGTTVSNGSFVTGGSIDSAPTVPTRAGYSLEGWTATDGDSSTVTFPYAPGTTSPITLYAKWTANTNAVTYDAKGGTSVTNGSFTTGGSIDSAPTASIRSGYTFAGWSATDGGAVVSFPYSPPQTSAITLYAKWNLNPVSNNPAPAAASTSTAQPATTNVVSAQSNYTAKSLATQVGVITVSPKATVTISVAKSSKKFCTKSGSKLKTLKAGSCVVTITVQEPKPKGGKKPKATKTTKTLVVS